MILSGHSRAITTSTLIFFELEVGLVFMLEVIKELRSMNDFFHKVCHPPVSSPFITEYLRGQAYRIAPTFQLAGVGVGAAVLDQWANSQRGGNQTGGLKTWDVSTTSRAIGLLHLAASGGHSEAQLALGVRSDLRRLSRKTVPSCV